MPRFYLCYKNYFFTERNAAPIHDDASHDLKSCFDKYGISHESLAYCLHITTTAMSKTKRSPEKDYLSNLLRNLMNKDESWWIDSMYILWIKSLETIIKNVNYEKNLWSKNIKNS